MRMDFLRNGPGHAEPSTSLSSWPAASNRTVGRIGRRKVVAIGTDKRFQVCRDGKFSLTSRGNFASRSSASPRGIKAEHSSTAHQWFPGTNLNDGRGYDCLVGRVTKFQMHPTTDKSNLQHGTTPGGSLNSYRNGIGAVQWMSAD